jgi:hypothetical protein
MRLVFLILCLCAATDAYANNAGQIVQIVGVVVSFWFPVAGLFINMVGGIYGAQQAQRAATDAARAAQEAARQSFNNALRDRTVTRVSTDSPHVYIYGRARVGSAIVAMFTSGAKDEYKHLVCVHAAHECDAIEEMYIGGNVLGVLDGNGDVTTGTYAIQSTASVAMDPVSLLPVEMFNGNVWFTAHANPISASIRVNKLTVIGGVVTAITPTPFTLGIDGRTITITSGVAALYAVYYDYTVITPMVRVTKHLGVAGDPADPALIALGVGWLPSSTLTGLCYTVVRLNLNQPEFQGGIPAIEAVIRGKKLYDVRTSTRAWSQNPALAVYDYLTSEMCGVPASDIPMADYITAANVCDEQSESGTAQAATSMSLTLAAAAHTALDYYASWVVKIIGGTGAGQTRNVMTSIKNWFVHSKYADTATWNRCSTVTTSGNQVTSTNAVDPFVGQFNDTGVALARRTFTISADLWLDAADGGIPYQFLLYDGLYASINMSPVFNLSMARTHYSFTATFPAGITSSSLTGRLDPQTGFSPGMYFRAENWNVVEGADVPFISTASTPAVGIAIDTPWAIIPDATSVYSFGNVSPRYTINGTITADQDQAKMLDALAACMAGGIVGTTWSCWAGKYIAPIFAIDQSDIIGALSVVSGTSDASLYNGIKGQFIGAENSYVVTDFAPYQNSAYVTADGGQQWNNIDFLFTDTSQRIWNLCRIYLEDQRLGFTVKATFSLKCWGLRCGDRVTFTSTFLGQSSTIYRVTDKKFGQDQGVELTLKADVSTIWDSVDATTAVSAPVTNLQNPFLVGTPGNLQVVEQLYTTTGSVGVRSSATASWSAVADSTVIGYRLFYKPYDTGVWIVQLVPNGTNFTLTDPAPGKFDFKVCAVNSLGVVSAFTPTLTTTLYGLTAAPSNVTGFNVIAMAGMAWCSWNKTADLDVKIGGRAIIRHCTEATPTWEKSYQISEFTGDTSSGFAPLYSGTYFIKFVDSTGHYSDTAASFAATETFLTGYTTVFTSTQQPTFAGSKTGVYVDAGSLELLNTTLVDDYPLVDTLGLWDFVGGVGGSGEYLFDATVDLSTSASRRFFASIVALSYDTGDGIDQRLALIDTWSSFDGSAINDTNVVVSARVSDDNITYGPWTPFLVADFKCRYAQLKANLTSGSSNHDIAVSTLSVAIKTSP